MRLSTLKSKSFFALQAKGNFFRSLIKTESLVYPSFSSHREAHCIRTSCSIRFLDTSCVSQPRFCELPDGELICLDEDFEERRCFLEPRSGSREWRCWVVLNYVLNFCVNFITLKSKSFFALQAIREFFSKPYQDRIARLSIFQFTARVIAETSESRIKKSLF